jgi:hypothetical protein
VRFGRGEQEPRADGVDPLPVPAVFVATWLQRAAFSCWDGFAGLTGEAHRRRAKDGVLKRNRHRLECKFPKNL